LTTKDFLSLDEGELFRPRQADGDLPSIGFMYPTTGNALIDAGVDVGLPFRGSKPDLGAFDQ
jgi:pectate lyase